MNRVRLITLTGLALSAAASPTAAQAVYVDVGVGGPGFGARVVYGAPVVVHPPVVVVEPVVAYPAPSAFVYFETWPVAYWDYVRVHHPHRYVVYRRWLDWEHAYRRAWHRHDRHHLADLRRLERSYRRERRDAARWYASWAGGWGDDDDRGRGRGRGRARGRGGH
jgi:hypothetical protein